LRVSIDYINNTRFENNFNRNQKTGQKYKVKIKKTGLRLSVLINLTNMREKYRERAESTHFALGGGVRKWIKKFRTNG